jgi:hypothetical protein
MGRVVVRDSAGRPRQLSTRTIKARKEKEEILTEDAQGNEKRTEFKYGTEEVIDVDELVLRDGGDASKVEDFRPILQHKEARSKNGSRLRLTEFWV